MKKQIKVIRDLSLVEKELNSTLGGVISISIKKEGFAQFATNFVYQNKNIFFYLDNEELLRTIKLDALAKFTVLSEKNVTKELLDLKEPLYRLFSVVVTGVFRKSEEKKTINSVAQSFIEKYSGKLIREEKGSILSSSENLFFVDSEELLAYDEIGY
jgi:hypothetical protein